MIFEQIATGGCQSYLIGCGETCAAALIDPEIRQIDRYQTLATRDGLRIRFVIDTHTRDSMCLVTEDRVFTGDTLLIGATGRTDLPTGDPDALFDSLFNKVLQLD